MNIFVAKLSPSTDGDGLREIFEAYGEVISAKVIMDRDTGRSKCYGFVEMQDETEGRNAVAELDQSQVDGNTIVVKESEPRRERGGNNFRNDRNRGGRDNRGRRDGGGGGFNTDRW
ncbi:MAG: RNA-binding protein [Bacteroidia bacterium]|nr:RNA-binding protein [Bacteroidia bacterium]